METRRDHSRLSSRAAIRFDNRPEECHKPAGDACPPASLAGDYEGAMADLAVLAKEDGCTFCSRCYSEECRDNLECDSILPSCSPCPLSTTEKLNK